LLFSSPLPLESRQYSVDSQRLVAETSQAETERAMVVKKAARSVAVLQLSISVEKDRVCELEKQLDSTLGEKLVLIQKHKKGGP
jgi:hypothetical protein